MRIGRVRTLADCHNIADFRELARRRLVDRLFGGRAAPLLVHLVEAEALSEEDIAEIERLIREMKQ